MGVKQARQDPEGLEFLNPIAAVGADVGTMGWSRQALLPLLRSGPQPGAEKHCAQGEWAAPAELFHLRVSRSIHEQVKGQGAANSMLRLSPMSSGRFCSVTSRM